MPCPRLQFLILHHLVTLASFKTQSNEQTLRAVRISLKNRSTLNENKGINSILLNGVNQCHQMNSIFDATGQKNIMNESYRFSYR